MPFTSRAVEDFRNTLHTVNYAYSFERILLGYLAETFYKLPKEKKEGLFDDEDPLKVFVDCLSGKDIGKFKRLVKNAFGKKGLRLLFEEVRPSLEVMTELNKIKKERGVGMAKEVAI